MEKHRVYQCKLCDKKSSSRFGLMMHMKAVHPKPIKETDLEEEDISGKRKIESVVDRLAHDPKGNTIRTSAGFMVVAKDGEHGEELSEDQIKLTKFHCIFLFLQHAPSIFLELIIFIFRCF